MPNVRPSGHSLFQKVLVFIMVLLLTLVTLVISLPACRQAVFDKSAQQPTGATTQSSDDGTSTQPVNPEPSQTPDEELVTPTTGTSPIPEITQTVGGSSPLTILSLVGGKVLVQKSGTEEWVVGKERMTLATGDKVKADIDSTATIIFFEGSVIELEGETEIGLSEIGTGEDTSAIIRLKQEIGTTISRVQKLVDPTSLYEIETVAAVVGVRGTTMKVSVAEDGTTIVENIEGLVSVVAQDTEIIVPAGEQSTVTPGNVPNPPQPVVVGPKTVELAYDTNHWNGSWGLGNEGHGYLIRFSPPGIPFTISKARVFGKLYGTGYDTKQFVLRITNNSLEPIWSASYSCSVFPTTQSWVDLNIPDIVVNDDFCIEVFANSLADGGIAIFYDSSFPNQHSSEIREWTKEVWTLSTPKETTNWMIRVVGTY